MADNGYCDRHLEILDTLSTHDARLTKMELADVETKAEIKHLIKEVERLVSTMEKFIAMYNKLIIGSAMLGIGFIIWYIQTH